MNATCKYIHTKGIYNFLNAIKFYLHELTSIFVMSPSVADPLFCRCSGRLAPFLTCYKDKMATVIWDNIYRQCTINYILLHIMVLLYEHAFWQLLQVFEILDSCCLDIQCQVYFFQLNLLQHHLMQCWKLYLQFHSHSWTQFHSHSWNQSHLYQS